MAFPYKLYHKLVKFDFVTGLEKERGGGLIIFIAHDLRDEDQKLIKFAIGDRKVKFVVAGPVNGSN